MKAKNLTGQRFGRLIAIERAGSRHGAVLWKCRCVCGTITFVTQGSLHSGGTTSCGCSRDTKRGTHGMSQTVTHKSWRSLLDRCLNPNAQAYGNYGGRGIKVDERWQGKHGFKNFLADVGVCPPGRSIDRHPDPNGNYESGNVRWATDEEQQNNTRANHWIEYEGQRKTVAQWSRALGIPVGTLRTRIRRGMSVELILYTGDLRPAANISRKKKN